MRLYKLLVGSIIILLSYLSPAQAQLTPTQLIAEINANFPTNGVGFITAALARQTLIDMVNSMATTVTNPTPASAIGAKCDGATDDTAAFNSAPTALPRGGVVRIPDGANCIVAGTVTYAADGIYLMGGGFAGRDSAGSTITCTQTTASNCIVWNGFTGGGLLNLRIDASARTGAACTVSANTSSHLLFQNLFTIDNNSWCLTSTNTTILDNVTGQGKTSGGSGLAWMKWIGTTSARSDVVIIQNSGYNGNNGGSDCIDWDGLANTMTIISMRCLGVNYGMHMTNANGNNSNYPAFLQAYDLEVDGGTGAAMKIDVGGYYRCIHCDLFHSTNDVGVIIASDNPGTIVRSVQFFGARIGNSGKQCVTTNAQGVRFVGVSFGSCSLNGAGLFPAIEVQSQAVDTEFEAGSVLDFGDSNNASPGIQLDSGSSRTSVIGLDLHYPAVPYLDNSAGQDNLWLPFIGQQSFLSFGKSSNGTDQVVYAYKSRSGSNTTVRVENPNVATSSAARYELATGTASSFADLTLTDGATPQVSMTTGSGVIGGINLDASAATGGSVALKAAANQTINITSSVPMVQTNAVAYGSLPTCVSGLAGARAMINNGLLATGWGVAVAGLGGAFLPVFCNGAAWIYG
jgi:hypothetical protein